MSQFRWISKVVVGPWRRTRNEAMCDALSSNHAGINPGKGAVIVLRDFTSIEIRKGKAQLAA